MSSLVKLDLDTLAYICQFLYIYELEQFSVCNKFINKFVKSSPQCITSLQCAQWTKHLILHDCSSIINRLSMVKELYVATFKSSKDISDVIFARFDIYQQNMEQLITNIAPNITDIALTDSKIKPNIADNLMHEFVLKLCPNHLQSIELGMNLSVAVQIFTHLYGPDFKRNNQLKQLKLAFQFHKNLVSVSAIDLLQKLFIIIVNCQQLQELEIIPIIDEYPQINHQNEWLIDTANTNIYKQSGFWKRLKSFKFQFNECSSTTTSTIAYFVSLCRLIMERCTNMECLVIDDSNYNTIYPQLFKNNKYGFLNCISGLKDIYLGLWSLNVTNLLQHIATSSPTPKLEHIVLFLWNRQSHQSLIKNGSNILFSLKCLLESQLYHGNHLKKIEFLTDSVHLERYLESFNGLDVKRMKVLYLLLIEVFSNERMKYYHNKKEMEIVIRESGESKKALYTNPNTRKILFNYLSCHWNEINVLMDVLHNKIWSCSMLFLYSFSNRKWFHDTDFASFEYNLQSKHDWRITVKYIPIYTDDTTNFFSIVDASRYYKQSNIEYLNDMIVEYKNLTIVNDDICNEEWRLNENKDKELNDNEDVLLITSTTMFQNYRNLNDGNIENKDYKECVETDEDIMKYCHNWIFPKLFAKIKSKTFTPQFTEKKKSSFRGFDGGFDDIQWNMDNNDQNDTNTELEWDFS